MVSELIPGDGIIEERVESFFEGNPGQPGFLVAI